jgi:exosortase/archaeosortase family protein
MKQSETRFAGLSSLLNNRVNLFLILAFAPLLIIFWYSPFGSIISLYGFLLLLIKRQKLLDFRKASRTQMILGLVIVLLSTIAYYAVVLVYPDPTFYGVTNYVLHILGLFLTFFEFTALKEAFAPLFLIVAATSSSFMSDWLKPFLSPFATNLAHLIVGVLRTLGINASIDMLGNVPMITLSSLSGKVVSSVFAYECMGISSALIFSIILIVIMFEDPGSLKTKLTYSILGLLGTFALNILRIEIIFLTDYFFGQEMGANVHYSIGYALFSIWLVCFFYIYSKRQTLHVKIASFRSTHFRRVHDPSQKQELFDKPTNAKAH